jgi:hypothetical protein
MRTVCLAAPFSGSLSLLGWREPVRFPVIVFAHLPPSDREMLSSDVRSAGALFPSTVVWKKMID